MSRLREQLGWKSSAVTASSPVRHVVAPDCFCGGNKWLLLDHEARHRRTTRAVDTGFTPPLVGSDARSPAIRLTRQNWSRSRGIPEDRQARYLIAAVPPISYQCVSTRVELQ